MSQTKSSILTGAYWVLGISIPVILLSLILPADTEAIVFRTFFVASTVLLTWLLDPDASQSVEKLSRAQAGLFVISFVLLIISITTNLTVVSWAFLATFFAFLITLTVTFSHLKGLVKWIAYLMVFGFSGLFPTLVNQIVHRFSEEEFYTFLMMGIICAIWLLLCIAYHQVIKRNPGKFVALNSTPALSAKASLIILALLLAITIGVSARSYQNSFYLQSVEDPFPGISSEEPIYCGSTSSETEEATESGVEIQQRYAEVIAGKEDLTTIDYGFLATYYQDEPYYGQFRKLLLADAQANLYAEPARSVKWGQWLASQTIYYYLEVLEQKPTLFSENDKSTITSWITAINERALKAGWVDWMYGLAFSHPPVGAYLNQDIGAGLYAILNQVPSLDQSLIEKNSAFLSSSQRGWLKGFRVSDDALSYQPVWITNSLFQAMQSGEIDTDNQSLSFDWLLAQALPDGGLQTYNFPSTTSLVPISLLGANIEQDGRLLWLADRGMTTLGKDYRFPVQVGSEKKISDDLTTEIPTIGSCLIYADSGLPEQVGPLSPDKVVFRNGWSEDDLYLLLNLRFTGWHRYKASNAISLVYAGQPLIEEQYTQDLISWLPIGRALVRDKRIPIEHLNTLLIPRRGLDSVLNTLVGLFGNYSQDPPFYASVEEFKTLQDYDFSKTVLDDWNGWKFTRSIQFFHDGPVIVRDTATSELKETAQIQWHFSSDYELTERNRLHSPDVNVDFVLAGQENGNIEVNKNDSELSVRYYSPKTGNLQLTTIILPQEYWDAQIIELTADILTIELDSEIMNFALEP